MGTVNTLPTASNTVDGSDPSKKPTSSPTDSLANESTFLTLLVTQLKNQNPMNPMDGTQFVSQLAQFSDLEQSLAMRQDLDALTTKYAPSTDSSSSSTTNSSTDNSTTPSSKS